MNEKQKRLALEAMKRCGIGMLTITFDGSGDSGQIDDIEVGESLHEDLTNIPIPPIEGLEIRTTQGQTMDAQGNWVDVYGATLSNMHEFVEQFAYDLLADTQYDWVNNDGGFGTIVIVPGTNSISVEMSLRVTTTEDFQFEMGLEEDEEVERAYG